jgi:type IV secretory pathway TraG/TraD family ATPase VirD4
LRHRDCGGDAAQFEQWGVADADELAEPEHRRRTRDGIYETARTAAQCLRDDAILAWVTRPALRGEQDLGEFDVATFASTRQTLYLLSKEGAGAAAPLVAALTDRVMRAATRAAERAGGRLDPPLVVVLDEAANVCRIGDLPELYSHFGSRGIIPITILQSYRQGEVVWGRDGMDALWSAATIKLVGAGIDDARFAEDLSRLIGEHDVPVAPSTTVEAPATPSACAASASWARNTSAPYRAAPPCCSPPGPRPRASTFSRTTRKAVRRRAAAEAWPLPQSQRTTQPVDQPRRRWG